MAQARRHPFHRFSAEDALGQDHAPASCATSPPGRKTVGDTTTLEDYSVLAKLRDEEE